VGSHPHARFFPRLGGGFQRPHNALLQHLSLVWRLLLNRVLELLVVTLVLCGVAGAQQSATGERLFKNQCASCHSGDGSSSSEIAQRQGMRDLRAPAVQALTDEQILRVISDGRGRMPAYGKYLKPEQLTGLVGYLRELSRASKPRTNQSASE
jgi:cytochrome c6